MSKMKYLGHSCFLLSHNHTAVLIDPFLSGNPHSAAKPDEIDCQYILVSHAHADHLGDAVAIAKQTGALIVSTAEVAHKCSDQGAAAHAMHLGGKRSFDFGFVRITPAFHGSGVPGGHACGFVIGFYGKIVYHAGDTALFGDMALLGRLESIDVALLPIGDNFTMGPRDAAEAAHLLKPQLVVPMHYNTWPVIAQEPESFKQDVETRFNIPVHVMQAGDEYSL